MLRFKENIQQLVERCSRIGHRVTLLDYLHTTRLLEEGRQIPTHNQPYYYKLVQCVGGLAIGDQQLVQSWELLEMDFLDCTGVMFVLTEMCVSMAKNFQMNLAF